jgi:hypothetical protein
MFLIIVRAGSRRRHDTRPFRGVSEESLDNATSSSPRGGPERALVPPRFRIPHLPSIRRAQQYGTRLLVTRRSRTLAPDASPAGATMSRNLRGIRRGRVSLLLSIVDHSRRESPMRASGLSPPEVPERSRRDVAVRTAPLGDLGPDACLGPEGLEDTPLPFEGRSHSPAGCALVPAFQSRAYPIRAGRT